MTPVGTVNVPLSVQVTPSGTLTCHDEPVSSDPSHSTPRRSYGRPRAIR